MAKIKAKQPKYEELGAQLLGYEIAISCFFEIFARAQPSTALEVAKSIRAHAGRIDEKKFPGLASKAQHYASLLEAQSGVPLQ